MRFLDVADLVHLADLAVGGQALVRDLGLLSAAAARPASGFSDVETYPRVMAKAASLLHSRVRNRALADSNKRLGWTAIVVHCDLNGLDVQADDDEAYDAVIALAEGRRDVAELTELVAAWTGADPH